MHYSSSSSDGSSRSGSPDTRATTPPASSECCNSHFPASYIRILASLPSSSTLEALFEKHASCGRLGLVIDDDAQFANDVGQKEWTKVADPVEHCVSKSYTPIGSQPILTTDSIQAGHLRLFSLASLRSVLSIALSAHSTLHVLEKPAFSYLPLTYITAHSFAPSTDGKSGNIPSIDEWKTLWANWDLITLKMIPPSMLHQKPIDLRHKCLFYIGHIPTFLDMLISKSIGGEATEPKWFWKIFERGIDPHVDDPNHCHVHLPPPSS
ncbi:hypothetical protein NLJ89_g11947 [Agrocybe chaxingu]|uniref:Uncharacterized protein n=1 Tax=Agrocybe chaxingu TaxID=84603 RepID=A0A9W8JKY6_9AGAR|nr:hypothetical protein NLJ89_g11947 [Agrocybe chaxingu]